MSIIDPTTLTSIPWRFVLRNSFNMSKIDQLGIMSDPSLQVILDTPGQAGFTYPLDDPLAKQIVPYKTCITTERYNWRETQAKRNAGLYGDVWDTIWSGYVLPLNEDWAQGKTTVSCVGWKTRFNKRINRRKFQYQDLDDGDLILRMLQHLNNLDDTAVAEKPAGVSSAVMADGYKIYWPVGSSPNTSTWMKYGGMQPNEGVGGATAYVPLTDPSMGPAPRDLTLDLYQQIGPQIDNLVNLENGCDVVVDPITRAVTVHRQYARHLEDDVVIGFQWGPANASSFTRQIDADQKVNYLLAQGDPTVLAQYADDIDDMKAVGPIEEVQSLGTILDTRTLLAYAGAEIIVRKDGVITYGITPMPYTPNSGVPEPFVEYREGDFVKGGANYPGYGLISDQSIRVFGFNVSFDNNMNEQIGQLELAPSSS